MTAALAVLTAVVSPTRAASEHFPAEYHVQERSEGRDAGCDDDDVRFHAVLDREGGCQSRRFQ